MIKYYDPLYSYKNRDIKAVFYNEHCEEVANEIIRWAKEQNN